MFWKVDKSVFSCPKFMQQITDITDRHLRDGWTRWTGCVSIPFQGAQCRRLSVVGHISSLFANKSRRAEKLCGNYWRGPVIRGGDSHSGFLSERLSGCLVSLSVFSVSCCLQISTISPLQLTAALSQLGTKAWQWLASPGWRPHQQLASLCRGN